MIESQPRQPSLTLPADFGERLILAARLAVKEHLRQNSLATFRALRAQQSDCDRVAIVVERQPGAEAA